MKRKQGPGVTRNMSRGRSVITKNVATQGGGGGPNLPSTGRVIYEAEVGLFLSEQPGAVEDIITETGSKKPG